MQHHVDKNQQIKSHSEFGLFKFACFLVGKIECPLWKQVLEACIPILQHEQSDLWEIILPYFVYFTLRQQTVDEMASLTDLIGKYLNEVLQSENVFHKKVTLEMLEFFKITVNQDKQRFKQFLEAETKFKYNEKLFFLDVGNGSDQSNADIQNFKEHLNRNPEVRKCFLTVKKLNRINGSFIDKNNRNNAAKDVSNYKRCLYNLEDTYRTLSHSH